MIRLLVDSASDYTQEEIENKNLYFVPLQIQIEGKNYLDGVDIDTVVRQLYNRKYSKCRLCSAFFMSNFLFILLYGCCTAL